MNGMLAMLILLPTTYKNTYLHVRSYVRMYNDVQNLLVRVRI